jgi:hypothetical protein
MAILKSGFLGGFRKKLGPAIGRRHMGQNLLLPLPHPSNKPATPEQLEAQLKLGLLNTFLSRIAPLIKIGFKRYVKHNSPVNAAFSYNYDHAFIKQGDQYFINYPKIVYSRGHIVVPESPQVLSAEGKISFNWLPQNQSAYCQHTDLASFLIYTPAMKGRLILLDKANRYSKTFVIELPKPYIGETVHCYMNFRSADGKLNGDSIYVGEHLVK